MGFNFERNLPHQENAVKSVINVFKNVPLKERNEGIANHQFEIREDTISNNIRDIQKENGITNAGAIFNKYFNLDIKMETGTGKTYTYTKTIFELNREYGLNKFIIVVPTLPIKAGTEQFLKSDTTRLHFKEDYGKTIELHVISSQKKAKKKREYFPLEISNFVRSTYLDNKIHVLLINTGMVNSSTMNKIFDDSAWFGSSESPFNLVAHTKPFIIIDEPHKYKRSGKSYENLLKFNPQCMIRYGATFPEKTKGKVDYENLLYNLDAVRAFNEDLVKGVAVHIPEFVDKKNAKLILIGLDGKNASFKYVDEVKEQTFHLQKGDGLSSISTELQGISIERLNKNIVELSNGIILEKRQAIHPSSFSDTYQEVLMKKAIDEHFQREKEYFSLPVKIKPLTLFFIDDVHSYREEEGKNPYIKDTFERLLKQKIEGLLKENISEEYESYLKESLASLQDTHGGYFSKDNTDKDEKIQDEIEEILRDKEKLLAYKHEGNWNTRRFIFSKWTLKEGWDNPNVFVICKLRSSGSEISKLQEVGRGLRLPVNEALFRVKTSQFELSYIVDFTEREFAENLIKEINNTTSSNQIERLTNEQILKLSAIYNKSEDEIFQELLHREFIDNEGRIEEKNRGELYLHYPELNNFLKRAKVRKADHTKPYVTIRQSNYEDFKHLWETINQKVLIDYNLGSEDEIIQLLFDILKNEQISEMDSLRIVERKVQKSGNMKRLTTTVRSDSNFTVHNYIETIPYNAFLLMVSKATSIPLQTLHTALVHYNDYSSIDTKSFFTRKTAMNLIKHYQERIDSIILQRIEYKKMDIPIHPTALTNVDGTLKKVAAYTIGTEYSDATPQEKYLYNEFFYDSNENTVINEDIEEVIVFGKIPKNSIRIPVINGKTYSPDFAYVVKQKNGDTLLNIIIESKNKEERFLSKDEEDKISLANKFFQELNKTDVKVVFEKQMRGKHISHIISKLTNS